MAIAGKQPRKMISASSSSGLGHDRAGGGKDPLASKSELRAPLNLGRHPPLNPTPNRLFTIQATDPKPSHLGNGLALLHSNPASESW